MDTDDWHQCHFCGTEVKDGYEDTEKTKRHWLSDCRPDLTEHEPGPLCTWSMGMSHHPETTVHHSPHRNCYAYQEYPNGKWTDEHKYFYKDGPM